MDKKALQIFLNKKVFIKLRDDNKTQVGVLTLENGTYFLKNINYFSAISPDAIDRITEEVKEE